MIQVAELYQRLSPADAQLVGRLHADSFGRPWSAAAFSRLLADRTCFGWCAILAGEDTALGFVLARMVADESEILTLGVSPKYRRCGIGCNLLLAVLDEAVRGGVRRVVLEVGADNEAARALYIANGFLEVGRRPAYYRIAGESGEDALILARALDVRVDAG